MSTRGLLLLVALVGSAELFARGYLADRPLLFHTGAWLLAACLWFACRRHGSVSRRAALATGLALACVSLAELWPRAADELTTPGWSFSATHGEPRALRLWWDAHERERRVLSGEQPLEPNQQLAWFGSVVELDAQGLRPAVPAPAGAHRIVVTGGSAVFGATLAPGDLPWPELLEIALAARFECQRPISVRNAGRPGRTLRELTQRFDADIAPLAPDLLVVYPDVDALTGLLPGDTDALAAAALPARASRVLRGLERVWRERAAARALHTALAMPPAPGQLLRGATARRYRRLLVAARERGIDVALVSPVLAVDPTSPEARIRFHESVWPDTRRLVVENRDHAALLPRLGVSYRAAVLDLDPELAADPDAFIDLVHPSATGNRLLASAAARAMEPLLARPDPGCALRAGS